MSDQDDVFNSDDTTPQPETPAAPADPFNDKLKGITNEHGQPKYDSVEKALDALKASQDFIAQLKAEKAAEAEKSQRLAAELEKMGSIDDFVKRVSPTTKTETKTEATPQPSSGLSEEQVAALVQKQLDSQRKSSEQEQNLASVIKQLTDVHGDKTAAHIKQRAEALGKTPAQLKELAKSDPKLAMLALGGEHKSSPAPSRSSQSSSPSLKKDEPLKPYEKSVARGGFTGREMAARWREVGRHVHKELGVENSPYQD